MDNHILKDTMNEEASRILFKWKNSLVNELCFELEIFVKNLLRFRIIDRTEYDYFLTGTDPRQRCDEILSLLSARCNVNQFLSITRRVNVSLYQSICNTFKETEINVPKPPNKIESGNNRGQVLENFRDKIFEKLHDGNEGRTFCMVKKMLESYLKMHNNSNLNFKDRRSVADSCFVLMDALTVNDRTYSGNVMTLWQHRLFEEMKTFILHVTDPQLGRTWYNSRYGMALALGNKRENGLDHVKAALHDAMMMQKVRHLGNCIFAYANIMLLDYSGHQDEKLDILRLIDWGIAQFMEESEKCRQSWRHVYLVKKAFCHLGIDYFMKDVPDVMISGYDITIARSCLNEMEQTVEQMNTRRKIHYLRARSKLHFLTEEEPIGLGYLQQAVTICVERGFKREEKLLKKILELLSNKTECNTRVHGCNAVEHDELDCR